MVADDFKLEFGKPGIQGLSAQRRRTIRNRAMIAQGFHPLTKLPLARNDETCGTCAHSHWVRMGNKYFKCSMNETSGPGTDIRVWWPACTKWEKA